MWNETLRALQTGSLAEIAVVAFVVAFVIVVGYAFSLSKREREHAKHLPLQDDSDAYVPPSRAAFPETDE